MAYHEVALHINAPCRVKLATFCGLPKHFFSPILDKMLEENPKQNQPEEFKKTPVNFLHGNQENEQPYRPIPKKRKVRFIIIIFASIILSFFILRAVLPEPTNNPYDYDPITLEPKKPEGVLAKISNFVFNREPKLEGHKDDRVNILLLGMGGPGHNGPFLTDTMIIASIKPSTGQVAMISIPRDLGVQIPGYGMQKINHANAYGEAEQEGNGAYLAKKVVEDTFNIQIPYYVRIDFEAFKEIIDAVGGIKIDVERSFVDREFPAPNDEYQVLTFVKGIQTMDGSRALQYARSRHGDSGEGSDFARAKRQQKVLLALKEKILSFQTLANPIRISKIIKSLGNHISNNIEFSNMIEFLRIGRSMEELNIINLVFDDQETGFLESGYTEEGAYILKPKSDNFKEMTEAIKNIFEMEGKQDSTPSQDTPAPKSININIEKDEDIDIIEIQNGTWRAGLAARTKERLLQTGLDVSKLGNTQQRPVMESGIYIVSEISSPKVIEIIQNSLDIHTQEIGPPAGELATSSTDILIILGEDFVE